MICYKLICKSSEMIKNVDGLKGVIGLPIKVLCISIIKIYNACIIMHSAKCDAVIPGEEQLLSIPYGEFVAFRESAVNIHSLFKLD